MSEENPYEKKPWLRFYDAHVPEHLEYPDTPFVQLFREAVEQCGDRVALYYMGRAIRFREVDLLSNRFAHFLREINSSTGLSSRRSASSVLFKTAISPSSTPSSLSSRILSTIYLD